MNAVHFAETGVCPVDSPLPARAASASACLDCVDQQGLQKGEALALHKHIGHFSTVMTLHYQRSDDFDSRLSQWLQEEKLSAVQQDLITKAAAALLRVHQDMDRSQALNAHLDALDFQLDG